MKKAKTFLAKVLTAAIMITSLLPMGTMTANAMPTVKTENEPVQWIYSEANGSFTMRRQFWIDSQTGKSGMEDPLMFGDNLLLGDAVESWGFSALASDGDQHHNLKDPDAATTIYASGIDIKSKDVRRVMQFDLVKLTSEGTQFGIMLKYVDENNWVYLGYNGNNWYTEWRTSKKNSDGEYINDYEGGYCDGPKVDGTWVQGSVKPYTNGEGQTVDEWNPAFSTISITQNKYLRIKIIYENSKNIRVAITELEEGKDADGNKSLVEKNGTTKENLLSFQAFNSVREYADAKNKEIYFGFIGDKRGSTPVKVNFLNVKDGALKMGSVSAESPDAWSEPFEELSFQDCVWRSPKTAVEDLEDVIKEQRIGSGVTYGSIGDPKKEDKKNPDRTIYNNMITDFSEGTIAADLRPYTVGEGKECYLGVITASSPSSPSSSEEDVKNFKVGIKDSKWVYCINDNVTEISGNNLPEIKDKTDYRIKIVIDKEGNVIADVTTSDEDGTAKTTTLISSESNVNVKNLSGSVCLTAKGEVLRMKHVTCTQITYEKTPLEKAYDIIVKTNANNEFYTDIWGNFAVSPQGALKQAANKLNGEHKDKVLNLSPQSPQNPDWVIYNGVFDEAAATALNTAFATINVDSNKVATGKAELQTAFDAVMTPQDSNADKWYSAESLAAYTATWNAVKNYLETSLNLGAGFAGVTKAEVDAKKAEIQAAPGKLEEKSADKDYLDINLTPALTAALAGIDLEDEENNSKYYNNWTDFKNTVEAAKALQTADPAPSIKDVDAKIAELNTAKENLTLKTVTSVDSYQSEVEKYTGDTITEDYYKGDFAAYTQALQNANGIKAGDSLKDADAKIQALKAAYEALSPKTLADDTAATKKIQDELNAVKSEVGSKKYVQNDKWTAYTNALAALEALMARTDSPKLDVEAALKTLKEAKAALTVDTTTASNDPAVGSIYTDTASGMKYKVGANQTLELTEGNKTVKSATIDTVTINGKVYKVTSIASNAFKNAKLTKVTIGDNVITINKNAFTNCKSLKTVVIGKNVKTIKANAFSKCTKINTITFKHTQKLPSMKNAFKNANKKPKKIQVAKALVKTGKKKNSVLKTLKKAGFKKITVKNIKGK